MSSFLSNHSISAVLFLSKVVFLRVLSYLLLYSYFSLMNFSPAHLNLSTRMPMTRPFILQLISILLLLLLLELLLVLIFFFFFLDDVDRISWWGRLNLVKFSSLKTKLLQISLSKTPSNFPISFDGSLVSPVDNINILGLNINKKMSWKPHITTVAMAASKKLGVLFRLRDFFFLFSVAPAIQGPHPPLYGVLLSYLGGLWFHPACR